MNSKETKTRLKDAREAIRVKDFQGAVAHCQGILEKEATNYNALVFLGVSCEGLAQIDRALDAYKKATSECPDQPLAWQGMGSILDKNPCHLKIQERIDVFEKLQSFTTGNEGKRPSYLHKLVCLHMEASNSIRAYEILRELLDLEKDGDCRVASCKAVVELLSAEDLSQDDLKLCQYRDCLNELLECPSLSLEDLNQYTKLSLYSKSMMVEDNPLTKWEDLKQRFPRATPPLEFGLQVLLEQSVGLTGPKETVLQSVQDMGKELEILSPENEMVKVAQGFLALHQKDYIQARDCLLGASASIICTQYYLCCAYLKLHDLTHCLEVCSTGLQTLSERGRVTLCDIEGMEDLFRLIQADAHRQMGSEEDQRQALELLEKVGDRRQNEAFVMKSYLYLDQGRLDDAQSCLQSLPQEETRVKLLTSVMLMAKNQYSEALTSLQCILTEEPEHAAATLKKGICLWELKDSAEIENAKQQCFAVLLKAAKLDPHNYQSFLYLGHFYQQVQNDNSKAIRCYRKSYDLNNASDDVGCAFVDALLDEQDQSQAIDVLKAVTSRAPAGQAKWAWLRLGLHQMKHEDPSTAILSLQSALRADPKDTYVWECLSEAYLHRGSLTAALKAFTKASELNPESTYCFYQIANIKQTLGLLPEAVKEYRHVLEREPTFVAALKGLGDSLILLAKQHLQHCLDGLAQDLIEEALAVLTRAAGQRPDISCLWKLMGDSCTLVSSLASNSYRIPSKLLQKNADSQAVMQVAKEQFLQTGSRCYSQAVKIMPENAGLWHDLGVNLYRQTCLQGDQHQTALDLLRRSRNALENACRLDPDNWRHWNALGVAAHCKVDPKLPFAQHCFIKSVECEANNVVAWSNLGVLYLGQGDVGVRMLRRIVT